MAIAPPDIDDTECVIVASLSLGVVPVLTDLNALTNDDGDFLTDDDGAQVVQG